jgi:hypothetical protein
MKNTNGVPAFFSDGVSGLGVRNGVARTQLMRLDIEGHPTPTCEVQIPAGVLKGMIETLRTISPA